MAVMFVLGRCFLCQRQFTFNADLVPSVPIDWETGKTPDLGGDPVRAVREPICGDCIERVNPIREENGLAPIAVLPGAYEPQEVG